MKNNKKKSKKIILIISIIFIVLILLLALIYFIFIKDDIKLKEDLNVEINNKVKILTFVNTPKKDVILTDNTLINTSTLGEQKLKIEYLNVLKKRKTLNFKITVVDTTEPVIECGDVIEIEINKDINIGDIKVSDNSNQSITPTIEGEYDKTKEGEYKVKIVAVDLSGNKSAKEVTIKVTAPKIINSGYYVYKSNSSEHGMQFKEDGSAEYSINFCPGMACGAYFSYGTYVVEGSKLTATFTVVSDESGDRTLDDPNALEFEIKNQNTLELSGKTFNYQEYFW